MLRLCTAALRTRRQPPARADPLALSDAPTQRLWSARRSSSAPGQRQACPVARCTTSADRCESLEQVRGQLTQPGPAVVSRSGDRPASAGKFDAATGAPLVHEIGVQPVRNGDSRDRRARSIASSQTLGPELVTLAYASGNSRWRTRKTKHGPRGPVLA
jgi:hypothetical protein